MACVSLCAGVCACVRVACTLGVSARRTDLASALSVTDCHCACIGMSTNTNKHPISARACSLSVCLAVCLSLSVCLCLSVCLSVCLSLSAPYDLFIGAASGRGGGPRPNGAPRPAAQRALHVAADASPPRETGRGKGGGGGPWSIEQTLVSRERLRVVGIASSRNCPPPPPPAPLTPVNAMCGAGRRRWRWGYGRSPGRHQPTSLLA